MLRPDGSHLFVRREFATCRRRVRGCEIGVFLGGQFINRLFKTGELHDHAGKLVARRGQGCTKCRFTGYYGRTGIFEVLGVNARLRHLISEGATPEALHRTARQDGLRSLREHAIRKVASGSTSFDEAMRATSDAEGAS